MTPGEFLRAVWPSEGIYCLATPFKIPNSNDTVFAHKTFDDIGAAVSFVLNERGSKDMFFAIHTLKQHTVFNPEKTNRKTGELGATEVRTHTNMKMARAFFFDLDVEPGNPAKYDSQKDALADLIRFCTVTGLPRPLVVLSGGGIHVYWIITDSLESDVWRSHARKLQQLAYHYGLRVDQTCTLDMSRVLRVAGTSNFKIRSNPRPVEAKTPATVTGTGVFIAMLDKAVIEAGVEVKQPPKFDAHALLGNNTSREWSGPPVSLDALLSACAQMKRLHDAKGAYSEPEWYHGVVGIGRFLEDGHRRVQQLSEGHRGYSHEATATKIHQHEARKDADGKPLGPTSCSKLAEVSGIFADACIGCPFAGKVHGPLGAARFRDPAPAPVIQALVTGETIAIPDPPRPFIRQKGGGVAVCAKNADGDETNTVIYEHDLFPIRRLANPEQGIEQQIWHVTLPQGEAKDFTLDADMLYDGRKFATAISNQGIYPNRAHLPYLQEYMVAYISQLQKLVAADAQCNHLGWSDDHTRFILPDKVLLPDGTARSAQLSLGAQRASAHVHKKGELAEQVRLLNFHNDARYVGHQFYILAGLAAPIFYMTGHHGVIINASGNAGASKSTSLYTAASFWGQPELYPINGTNNGATVRGRNERVTTLANLPVCVDEITHMLVRDAVDLAMSITQPGHRIRLQTDGIERASVGSYKATIMLTTANNSLHGMLSTDNAAGTAGSMRVIELLFEPKGVHTKAEADNFMHALKLNYGHVGELFMAHVIKNSAAVQERVREVVREIDTKLNIQPSERFWSAAIAVILVAGEIAQALGLLNYDMAHIRRWVENVQVPHMRGVVKSEYSDPLAILGDYLEQINSNMLVMEKLKQTAGPVLSNVRRRPNGALLAHYDTDDQMMFVLKKGFKDYCARIGANSLNILEELHEPRDGERIIANTHTKRTLGASTEYAKSQSWCFAVNMAHKDVSGSVDLSVIAGGDEAPTGPTAALRAV